MKKQDEILFVLTVFFLLFLMVTVLAVRVVENKPSKCNAMEPNELIRIQPTDC